MITLGARQISDMPTPRWNPCSSGTGPGDQDRRHRQVVPRPPDRRNVTLELDEASALAASHRTIAPGCAERTRSDKP